MMCQCREVGCHCHGVPSACTSATGRRSGYGLSISPTLRVCVGFQPLKNSVAATPKLPRNIAATTNRIRRERVWLGVFMFACEG